MSSTNSVIPFLGASSRDLQEAAGITQFPSQYEWFQVVNGLIIQGGYVEALSTTTNIISFTTTNIISFVAPFGKQTLGVFIQVVAAATNDSYVNAVTLNNFELINLAGARNYYWWAIGA